MTSKDKSKKRGFSLMEIVIALFIVAILTIVTVPIVQRQLEKADEFSYYVAYRTVERMASQIVTVGDADELADSNSVKIAYDEPSFKDYMSNKYKFYKHKVKKIARSLPNKFAKAEFYIFKNLFPSVIAKTETYTSEELSWDSSRYDEVWLSYHVCNGEQIVKNKTSIVITNSDGTTSETDTSTYYVSNKTNSSTYDIDCSGYTDSNTSDGYNIYANDNLKAMLISESVCDTSSSTLTSLASYIMSQSKDAVDAKSFCNSKISALCTGTKNVDGLQKRISVTFTDEAASEDGEDEESDSSLGEGFVEAPSSITAGVCSINSEYEVSYDESDPVFVEPDTPEFDADICDSMGFKNMVNTDAPNSIVCECKSAYVLSANNDKACVTPCANSEAVAYADSKNVGVCCTTDFNPNAISPNGSGAKGNCCPDHSVYNGGDKCVCLEGYKMNTSGTACEPTGECLNGSTFVDGACVVNPPITLAKNFCNKVANSWNISSSYCNAFQAVNGVNYYQSVYDAIKDTNGKVMSINSKVGAFGLDASGNDKIRPNIKFSNGLKMWILGDKAASIPGLSFTTEGVSASQNMCRNLKKSTHLSCSEAGGTFCKAEKNCFTMDAASLEKMDDARNCCGSSDVSDIAGVAQSSGEYEDDDYLKNTQAYAIAGFTIFVDINGDKGKGTLWDDVYPFYLGYDGTVYPGYPLDAPKSLTSSSNSLYLGGNSPTQLTTDVYYYVSTEKSRERKVAFSGVSFARAVCSARKVSKYTPYCMNLGEKFNGGNGLTSGSSYISDDNPDTSKNPCDKYKCFVSVRRKLKTL